MDVAQKATQDIVTGLRFLKQTSNGHDFDFGVSYGRKQNTIRVLSTLKEEGSEVPLQEVGKIYMTPQVVCMDSQFGHNIWSYIRKEERGHEEAIRPILTELGRFTSKIGLCLGGGG